LRLGRRLLAEFIGTMILVVAAISPTILAIDVLGADPALAVLMDAVAVGFVLIALIEMLGPISGCHINPAITLARLVRREIGAREAVAYVAAQVAGGLVGTLCTHLMFVDRMQVLWTVSDIARPAGTYFAEFLGTFILIGVVYGTARSRSTRQAEAIGLVVGGLLITTSSTMFANPAVTVARMFTYAIAGVRPEDGVWFIAAELVAAVLGAVFFAYLFARDESETTAALCMDLPRLGP
jgi:glycerol uptake facilitator-like aquaporin